MANLRKTMLSANDSLSITAQKCETFRFKNIPNVILKVKKKRNGDYVFIFINNGETGVYNIYEMLSIFYWTLEDRNFCHKAISALDKYATNNQFYWFLRDAVMSSITAWEHKSENSISLKAKKTYLIKDNRTGATKIGKSNNPFKREKTLQSEALTLELLYICNEDVEKILHKKYEHKRIRGEWFNLTDYDFKEIISKYNFIKAKK